MGRAFQLNCLLVGRRRNVRAGDIGHGRNISDLHCRASVDDVIGDRTVCVDRTDRRFGRR